MSETNVITTKFRVNYCHVFKPKLNKQSNKEEYSVLACFAKGADISNMKAAMQAAITKKWGPDKSRWPTKLKNPLKDQSEMAKNIDGKVIMPAGFEAGAIMVNLKSKEKPPVVDQGKKHIADTTLFYSGCYARAVIQARTFDMEGSKGVRFELISLQKWEDGEKLDGRTKPEDDYAEIPMDEGASGSTDDLGF
jgi:ssDNA-binding protein